MRNNMIALDSITPVDVIGLQRTARAAALRSDTAHKRIGPLADLPSLPTGAVTQTDGFTAFISTSWGLLAFCGVLVLAGLLLGWIISRTRVKANLAAVAKKAQEDAQAREVEQLRAHHEHLLTLLRERDRYMIQYEAVSLLNEKQYSEWNLAAWKDIARNHLAMVQAVRPLVYADCRARVRALSPTYRNLPGPALQAWQQVQQSSTALRSARLVDIMAESSLLAPEPEGDSLDWLFGEESAKSAIEPIAKTAVTDNVAAFIAKVKQGTPNKLDDDDPMNW
jgi:hypothetical protein